MNEKHSVLLYLVKKKIALSDVETQVLTSAFQIMTAKKNEFLIAEGRPSLNLYFVIDGYIRCFYTDQDGNEITTLISTNNDFVTSFESFLNNNNAKENIQCTSDCTLLSISKEDYENMYREISDWSLFCQSVYENHIVKNCERISSFQSLSASDRYRNLLNSQPDIAINTAVKDLASYLGIKPQSLSRIRKAIK